MRYIDGAKDDIIDFSTKTYDNIKLIGVGANEIFDAVNSSIDGAISTISTFHHPLLETAKKLLKLENISKLLIYS